jgi:hypothetical protein
VLGPFLLYCSLLLLGSALLLGISIILSSQLGGADRLVILPVTCHSREVRSELFNILYLPIPLKWIQITTWQHVAGWREKPHLYSTISHTHLLLEPVPRRMYVTHRDTELSRVQA